MDMVQQMIKLNANMALLGGSNYILSGCVDDGTNVSDGIIVINGELLPFSGGAKGSKITIQQTTQTLSAFGVDYPEAYIFRIAKFSPAGEYNWSDFVQVLTNQQLQQRIEAIRGDEPGIVKMWAGLLSRIPSDYHLCDGSVFPVPTGGSDEYKELFDNIGTVFGTDGSSGFKLPDLRGRFIVGQNNLDVDYDTIGKTGGEKEVTLEIKHLPSHNHRDVTDGVFDKLSARAADVDSSNTPGSTDAVEADKEYRVGGMTPGQWIQATIKSVGSDEAHENQPPYFVLAYIIKVK